MITKRFKLCRSVAPAASLMVTTLLLCCAAIVAPAARAQNSASSASSQATTARVPARITRAVNDNDLKTLSGNVHRLARAEFDRGSVADSQPANRIVLLLQRSPEQESALKQLLIQQQDKSSKNFHAWLTPDQFGKQFGPADSDIQAVTDWLTSRGFSAIKVSPSHMRVEFSGNIGQVRNTFHTEIHQFLVSGKMHMANVSDPQIPAALSPVVRGIQALHDFRPKATAHRRGTFRRTKDSGELKPLFTFNGCGGPCYAVGPADFAKIYNLPIATTPGTNDGTGVSIAIVQDTNINVADVTAYRTLFGLPNPTTSFTADNNIILNGPDPGIQGPDSVTDDEFEADLDVQLAGAVATGATVKLVVSENSQSIGAGGVDLSAIYVIDNNIAPILSESFGFCEPNITAAGESFYDDLWQQASAEGITVIVASGDSGSAACDQGNDFATTGLSVSGIASTPYNVAIGGTDFKNGLPPSAFWNATNAATTQASALGYIPESTWNDSCANTATTGSLATCTAAILNQDAGTGDDTAAAGGGPSSLTISGVPVNAKPTWQAGTTGNPADGFRDIPDISLFSGDGLNGSFYVICQQDQNALDGGTPGTCDLDSPFLDIQGVGGTSAGAPAFAGIMALVNQKTGQRQGNANFVLYQLYKNNPTKICASAASPAPTCIFYDLTTGSGNNSVACQGGSPNCSNTTAGAGNFGGLVDPAHITNPAWITTPGYDLATGLGSVNVTQLINAWSSATFTASTVTLTCATPTACGGTGVVHGTDVSFTVKVTPTTGTATGSVSLLASPTGKQQVAIGNFSENNDPGFALTAGVATFTTNGLPGGASYPVVANYGGDGTVAAGTSPAVNVTVTPEASKTIVSVITFDNAGNILSNNATTAPYGSPYILQIAVQDSAGNQCANVVVGCPTGTVTLTDNSAPVNDFSGKNTATLNNLGIAEDQPVQLGVGAHSFVAAYGGDNSFNSSSSAADAFTVTKSTPTNIAVAPASPSVAANQNVGLIATINTSSSGAGPTGTVTFSSGTTTLGTASVVGTPASGLNSFNPVPATGTATLVTKFATAGTPSFTASYAGDATYNSIGPSAAGTITVTGAGGQATTTTLASSTTSTTVGSIVKLTAAVSSTVNNGVAINNTVQFFSGTTALGSSVACTPSTSGTPTTPATCSAILMTSSLPQGTDSVTAQFNGDTNYAASTSSAVSITVAGATTTTKLISSATSISSGGSITFTASVVAGFNGGPAMTGTVQFMNGTTALGSPVPCAATASTLNTPAACVATLSTTLSMLPLPQSAPPSMPTTPGLLAPIVPLTLLTLVCLIAFWLTVTRAPTNRRPAYAFATIVLLACVATMAACGGGSSSTSPPPPPPPTSKTATITAVYSGDATYTGSTSAAATVTIQ